MSSYNLLNGVTVIEVAQLGPAALGGLLADMGARVIKVESPPDGDPLRSSGEHAVGSAEGVGMMHLRWNRGKESIAIDLRTAEGSALFKELAAKADVVVDGLRAGALDRMNLGYETLREGNSKLVFCSVSGFGLTGRYHELGSHAPSYDAFGGLMRVAPDEKPDEVAKYYPIAMYSVGLYAAIGVLSAVIGARATGQGSMIEVAAADVAALWYTDTADVALNPDRIFQRAGFADAAGYMVDWPRLTQYRTRDGGILFFEAFKDKFWKRFVAAVDRPDLLEIVPHEGDLEDYHQRLFDALRALFVTRDRDDWMALMLASGIPSHPLNSPQELIRDPHFQDRDLVYDVEVPGAGAMRLLGTPVKVEGQAFAPPPPQTLGASTDRILAELGVSEERLRVLRESLVVR